jgi:hypothetical protein
MKVAVSSEQLVNIYQSTRRHIPKDSIPHMRHSDDFKPQSRTLRMEAAGPSETSVDIFQIAHSQMPEDNNRKEHNLLGCNAV